MLISDIKRVVEQVGKDKGIQTEVLVKTLEEALASAARKILGRDADIEAAYNEEAGEIEVFQFREVVEDVENPVMELSIADGRKLDSECEVGDSLGERIDTSTFGRIAAQSAKQVIIQKMKDAERNAVYSSFIDRKGEIINGIVQRIDRGNVIVNLGQTEAILTTREQLPNEMYRRGDRIRALIKDVLADSKGPQIILTRASSDFLVTLFRTEVPEIMESIVTIEGCAREAGARSKIAVSSMDSDIDPVGACVGMKGSRVQNVVQELKGEKIDIITWHLDAARYVCNALAPAEVVKVIIDEDNHSMEVVVHDDFLSVAIGKRGQNVRLASQLTGWKLDVIDEASYSSEIKDGYEALLSLEGVSMTTADQLHQNSIFTIDDIKRSSVEDLMQYGNITEEEAESIIKAAENYQAPVTVDNVDETDEATEEASDDTVAEETDATEDEIEADDATEEVSDDTVAEETDVSEDEIEADEATEEISDDTVVDGNDESADGKETDEGPDESEPASENE